MFSWFKFMKSVSDDQEKDLSFTLSEHSVNRLHKLLSESAHEDIIKIINEALWV